ncbi:uncharacterized protein AB675_8705 [Cyphellophora attinorum]|uniref:Uncharacterized protein n=1 Tax=Cyphellophora attinorum TaxID=1664694 RepID=A0A0N1HG44_9EURO|nr:uncharacterized protein AB675_8705 [Phialophora attinorum]KPI44417.1 hypothetical protein AB675_8705 [Phialophora attinorum]
MDGTGELPDQPDQLDQPHQNGMRMDAIQEFTRGEQTPDEVDEDINGNMETPNKLDFIANRGRRGYPRQITSLPDEIPPQLGRQLVKGDTFKYERENRVFEDKGAAIWDRKKEKLYDYYMLSTREKLDARYYHVYATTGSTMGVTVVKGNDCAEPTILGRSPSMIPSHLRVWTKANGFADDTREVVRTTEGLEGVDKAVKRLQARQQRKGTSSSTTNFVKKRERQARRSEPWTLPLESDIFENEDVQAQSGLFGIADGTSAGSTSSDTSTVHTIHPQTSRKRVRPSEYYDEDSTPEPPNPKRLKDEELARNYLATIFPNDPNYGVPHDYEPKKWDQPLLRDYRALCRKFTENGRPAHQLWPNLLRAACNNLKTSKRLTRQAIKSARSSFEGPHRQKQARRSTSVGYSDAEPRPSNRRKSESTVSQPRPRLIVRLKMPKRNSVLRQAQAPQADDHQSGLNGVTAPRLSASERPSGGRAETTTTTSPQSPHPRMFSRTSHVPITAPQATEAPTEAPQHTEIPAEAPQEQEELTAESDSDDVQEIEAPAVPVKQEAPQNTSKLSEVPAEIGDQVMVVFRDDSDQVLRQRPWRDCSNVQKLFLQAVVGRLFKTSKEDTALSVTVQGLEEEIPIMKGDVDDFGVLCQAIAFAQNMKTEGGGEELVVDVKSL